jgi:hypothetical protein
MDTKIAQVTPELLMLLVIPGFLGLLAVGNIYPYLSITMFLQSLSIPGLIILATLSFIIGAIIDIIAISILTRLYLNIGKLLKQHSRFLLPNYVSVLSKDNIEVFRFLVDKTYLYERLCKNTFLAALILIISRILFVYEKPPTFRSTDIILVLLAIALAFASYQGQKYTADAVRGFYEGHHQPRVISPHRL